MRFFQQKVKVGIAGVTGYSGEELLRILIRHPHAEVTYVAAREDRHCKIQSIFPYLEGKIDLDCRVMDAEDAARACDLIFLALPHSASMQVAPVLLDRGKSVIDVSADYRLKNPAWYPQYYQFEHTDSARLSQAVYGLSEYRRKDLRGAKLVANPGCYPTASLLGLLPLLEAGIRWSAPCILDAKSGVTGAGRKASQSLLFSEIAESFKAYKVMGHQHEAEIRQGLAFGSAANSPEQPFVFIPHLLPINRGILATIYVTPTAPVAPERLREIYTQRYAKEPFVKVLPDGEFPELRNVNGTNQCHIGVGVRKDTGVVVIVSAIDNLQKGASGQAVQNMNLMYGFDETAGLR
jgi:N-acetyl-gamma-glutamyl-phosphate reductase